MGIVLCLGGRVVAAEDRVRQFDSCWRETGRDYLNYPCDAPDQVHPGDVAVTLAMNSGAIGLVFRTLVRHGTVISDALASVPGNVTLAEADAATLDTVADLLVVATSVGRDETARRAVGLEPLPTGVGVSVASKLLHKKRPALIPILDNQAVFRDYLQLGEPPMGAGCRLPVLKALKAIQSDLRSDDNADAWRRLEAMFENRTRLELFDMAWWLDNQARWFDAGSRKPWRCINQASRVCPTGCLTSQIGDVPD